jgi:sulfatase modifying factor 1
LEDTGGEMMNHEPAPRYRGKQVNRSCDIELQIRNRCVRTKTVVVTLLSLMLLAGAIAAAMFLQRERLPVDMSRSAQGQMTSPNRKLSMVQATRPRDADLIVIPAGNVQIGDDDGPFDEVPVFRYTSRAFLMDRTPATVAQFAAFVKDTGYRTDAEQYGSAGVLDERHGAWAAAKDANWHFPTGPGRPAAQADHPVTQISWFDANAFCHAYGARLPTEFEWERAARMGQTPDGHVFKRGDPIELKRRYLLNAWEGTFPLFDTGADGYRTTSPVGAFGTAPSGLTDMAGNVWEWTSSWYQPYGSPDDEPAGGVGERVARGGSFLCSPSLCEGYRASARNHATPDTSLENIGFRCAADPESITKRRVTRLAGRAFTQAHNVVQEMNRTTASEGVAQ